MPWGLPMSSKKFALCEKVRNYQQHKRRIALVPSTIDNKAPSVPRHLDTYRKSSHRKAEKLTKIDYDNRVLLKRLQGILSRPYKATAANKTCRRVKKRQLKWDNDRKRLEGFKQVTRENFRFAERLMSVKPTYSRKDILSQSFRHVQYRKRLSDPLLTPDMSKLHPLDIATPRKTHSFSTRPAITTGSLLKGKLGRARELIGTSSDDVKVKRWVNRRVTDIQKTKSLPVVGKSKAASPAEVVALDANEKAVSETKTLKCDGYLGGRRVVLYERHRHRRPARSRGKKQWSDSEGKEVSIALGDSASERKNKPGASQPFGERKVPSKLRISTDEAPPTLFDILDLTKPPSERSFGRTDSQTTIHPNSLASKTSLLNNIADVEGDDRAPGVLPLSVSPSNTKLESVNDLRDEALGENAKKARRRGKPGTDALQEDESLALSQKASGPVKARTAYQRRELIALISDARLLFNLLQQQGRNFPERALIRTLVKRDAADRLQIGKEFERIYGKNLAVELKKVLGRDWTVLIDALLVTDVVQKDKEAPFDVVLMADKLHCWVRNHQKDFIKTLVFVADRNMTDVRKAFQDRYQLDLPTFIDLKFKHATADIMIEVAKKTTKSSAAEGFSQRTKLSKDARQRETKNWLNRDWWHSHGAGSESDSCSKSVKTSAASGLARTSEASGRPRKEQQPKAPQEPRLRLPLTWQQRQEIQQLTTQRDVYQPFQRQDNRLQQQRQQEKRMQQQQQQLLHQLQIRRDRLRLPMRDQKREQQRQTQQPQRPAVKPPPPPQQQPPSQKHLRRRESGWLPVQDLPHQKQQQLIQQRLQQLEEKQKRLRQLQQRHQQQLRKEQLLQQQAKKQSKKQPPFPEKQLTELLQQEEKKQQQLQQQQQQKEKQKKLQGQSKKRGRTKSQGSKKPVVSYFMKAPVDDDAVAISSVANWNKQTPPPRPAVSPTRERNKKRGTLTASKVADVARTDIQDAPTGEEPAADTVTLTEKPPPDTSGDLEETPMEPLDLSMKVPLEPPEEKPWDEEKLPEEISTKVEEARIFRRRRYPVHPLLQEPEDSTKIHEEERDLTEAAICGGLLRSQVSSSTLGPEGTPGLQGARESREEKERRQESLRYRQRLEKALTFWSRAEEESKMKRMERLSRRRGQRPEWVSDTTIAREKLKTAEEADAQNHSRLKKMAEATAKRVFYTNELQAKTPAPSTPVHTQIVHDFSFTPVKGIWSNEELEKPSPKPCDSLTQVRRSADSYNPPSHTSPQAGKYGNAKRECSTPYPAKMGSGDKAEREEAAKAGRKSRTSTLPTPDKTVMPREYHERIKRILTGSDRQHGRSTFALLSNMFLNDFGPCQPYHTKLYLGSGGPLGKPSKKYAALSRARQIAQVYGDKPDEAKPKKAAGSGKKKTAMKKTKSVDSRLSKVSKNLNFLRPDGFLKRTLTCAGP